MTALIRQVLRYAFGMPMYIFVLIMCIALAPILKFIYWLIDDEPSPTWRELMFTWPEALRTGRLE
jgi:hypothetical protein